MLKFILIGQDICIYRDRVYRLVFTKGDYATLAAGDEVSFEMQPLIVEHCKFKGTIE
jgi:hypothetical protein